MLQNQKILKKNIDKEGEGDLLNDRTCSYNAQYSLQLMKNKRERKEREKEKKRSMKGGKQDKTHLFKAYVIAIALVQRYSAYLGYH